MQTLGSRCVRTKCVYPVRVSTTDVSFLAPVFLLCVFPLLPISPLLPSFLTGDPEKPRSVPVRVSPHTSGSVSLECAPMAMSPLWQQYILQHITLALLSRQSSL